MNNISNIRTYVKAYSKSLNYLFMRAIGRNFNTIEKAAMRSETLCNKHEIKTTFPFYWEKQLERIKTSSQSETHKIIDMCFHRKYFVLDPVTVYWLKDAVLIDGSVYSNGQRRELRSITNRKNIGLKASSPVIHMQNASLSSTSAGATWWGHWIRDEIPMQLLATEYAPLIKFNRSPHSDEKYYYDAFSLNNPICVGTGYFDELVIIDEHAQNPLKTKRYHDLRKRLEHIQGSADKIFLMRGNSGSKRILENENEIRILLENNGFICIDISSTTGKQLINICRGAEIVISVEGSHISPLLYLLKTYASIIILNPPRRIGANISNVCAFFGISSSIFICEQSEKSSDGFYINPGELIQFISEVISFSQKNKHTLDIFLGDIFNIKC